jgi:hypothetical protein
VGVTNIINQLFSVDYLPECDHPVLSRAGDLHSQCGENQRIFRGSARGEYKASIRTPEETITQYSSATNSYWLFFGVQ